MTGLLKLTSPGARRARPPLPSAGRAVPALGALALPPALLPPVVLAGVLAAALAGILAAAAFLLLALLLPASRPLLWLALLLLLTPTALALFLSEVLLALLAFPFSLSPCFICILDARS